ncbi:DUF732 domain-containing protein [Antrihabitans cavernicola]|uniref:DUF732 domain-containing protein n=1 Tax=Antrihabitans cavernicola TaxID=2495913 RepID=A0A5A7SEU5_9NOCA|nr:DUF732 domain-containing protein [Spelaeibacter cavernicola]KAA0024104.1 DUF732 domain-containing protein [Spelaeibacter cavernicola]
MVRRKIFAVAVLAAAVAGCSSNNDSPAAAPSSAPISSRAAAAPTTVEKTSAPAPSEETDEAAAPTEDTTQAMTPEADFLKALPQAGVPVRDVESVYGTGQRICKAVNAGKSDDDAAKFGVDEQQWTEEQAKTAVSIAKRGMCAGGN